MRVEKSSDIAKEVERLCKERGFSYYKLAKESGLPYTTVTNMNKKHTTPNFYNLQKMCNGLGITLAQFFAQADVFEKFTPDQKELMELYQKADQKSRERILQYVRGMVEGQIGEC